MIKSLKDFLIIIGSISFDVWCELAYFVHVNLRYAALIVELLLPYLMYVLGQSLVVQRGKVTFGGELILPALCFVVIHYAKEFSNKTGKGNVVPVPGKRFTDVADDGEITVDNARLPEMLLYMADLEDYLERKRLV